MLALDKNAWNLLENKRLELKKIKVLPFCNQPNFSEEDDQTESSIILPNDSSLYKGESEKA